MPRTQSRDVPQSGMQLCAERRPGPAWFETPALRAPHHEDLGLRRETRPHPEETAQRSSRRMMMTLFMQRGLNIAPLAAGLASTASPRSHL